MNFERGRRIFQQVFRLDRDKWVSKLLTIILVSTAIIEGLYVVINLLEGKELFSIAVAVNSFLLVFHIALLFVLQRGNTRVTALALIFSTWGSMTYQAWVADGVRDTAIMAYLVIILVAALVLEWRISLTLAILSTIAIWGFAFGESQGLIQPTYDSPFRNALELTATVLLMMIIVYLMVSMVGDSITASRQEEERFRRIFHISPVAICVTSLKDGRLIEANDAYWKLTGFDPQSSIGRTTMDLQMWEREEDRLRFVKRLTEQRSLHNPAYEFVNGRGEKRITIAFYELVDYGGEPTILSVFYDVTEQQLAQKALMASEEKYRHFVDQSVEGVWLLGFDQPIPTSLPPEEQTDLIYKYGYIVECNDSLARMYGYESSSDILGARLFDFTPGSTIDELSYRSTLKLVKDGYRSGNRETREVTRNGEIVHFLNNAVGVIKDGMLVGLWGTQLDITALKRIEDALRRSEARAQALLDAIPDMIFELKRDGTIMRFIPSATNDPLIPPEEFLGKTIAQVLPSLADQTAFAISRALESGQLTAFEYQMQIGEETRTFEARVTPAGPDLVLAMVRDVSLRKWAESERESLIDELEAKNAELERFTYTVSHDLKSPLITIRGFLGFIREDIERGNMQRLDMDIQRISDATNKMQSLLGDLLELSRIGRLTNKPTLIEMNALADEVIEYLYGRIHSNNITVRVGKDLPPVFGDRQRIFEVFQNLIDNAAKFMGDQPNPCIEIGWAGVTDGKSVFFVRDNGIGIAPEYKDRIFGLFNKLNSQTEGTGIGLALVKRIIEFHGGRIWVESEPDQGATFFFTLPAPPEPER